MATAVVTGPPLTVKSILAIGTHREADMPSQIEWYESAHPIPDTRSLAAGIRALDAAAAVGRDECLVLLLSGGASSLMAVPIEGLTLAEKQQSIRSMMLAGADIHALNTVRKHLSRIKGGRLAQACGGITLTLAISDVVGDDLSVIGSGPGVADATTWADARRALDEYGQHSSTVRTIVERGCAGELGDTPKPGDEAILRARGTVIASRQHALGAARIAAERLGYDVSLMAEEITGEARDAAKTWFERARVLLADRSRPACVLSAGETTVRVVGRGRGGRNQEFVLALTDAIARVTGYAMVASVGTDGIDGPTDAAGALVDTTTRARAHTLGLDPRAFLAENNAYEFFATLGDLIHTGRTDTNVGDIQVLLITASTTGKG